MGDILAIISKAQFEAAHPKAKVGEALGFAKYVSSHAALEPVRGGGSIFLVTVRPPDERLWLIGELADPKHDGKAWSSAPSKLVVRDVTELIPRIKFVNGKGISAKKGALGMSLQTPRQLSAEDVALLRGGKVLTVQKASTPLPDPLPEGEGGSGLSASPSLSLAAVLEEWRATRAPELEELIETLSKHHARAYPPLDPEADDYDAQWTARANAATAEGLAPLLPGLWSDPRGSIPMRLRKLLDLGADPRLGQALLTMIDDPPLTASSNFSAWSLLFKNLPSMVDTRASKRLQARAKKKGGESNFWPKLTAWIEAALKQLDEPAKLSKEQLASVTKRQKEAAALLKGPPPSSAVKEKATVVQPMQGSPRETLEVALKHAREGKFLATLEPLRQYWVVTRAPAAADLLTKFAKLGQAGQPRFDEGKAAAIHAQWLKAAKSYDATLVTPLLDALLKGSLADAEERCEVMLSWPPDPRVTDCMLNVIIFGRTPYIGARPQLFKRAYDLMVISADPRFRQQVEENAARLERAALFDRNRAERPHASRTLVPYVSASSSGRAPSPDEEQLLTELTTLASGAKNKKTASTKPDEELALLLTINAAGDDHTPRVVYADFLAERGDPRAEYINLTLALLRGEKVKGKLAAWEKANERALHGSVKSVSFGHHLGLPVSGTLVRYGKFNDQELDATMEDLRWATVRNLALIEGEAQLKFLEKAALYGVTHMSQATGAHVAAAAKSKVPWQVEHLDMAHWDFPDAPAAFPKLESIRLPLWGDVNEASLTSPLIRSVKRITLGGENVYGRAPLDLLIKHALTMPKLEAIELTSSAFNVKATKVDGKFDVIFELRSQPWAKDDYFIATLDSFRRIPAASVRSFKLNEVEVNGHKPRADALAAAKEATKHLV